MAATTNVKAVTLTSTGSVHGMRTRIKALSYVAGGTAGSIVLKNNGASGQTELNLATAADAAGLVYIPGDGILFDDNVHATLTNITSVTFFYG